MLGFFTNIYVYIEHITSASLSAGLNIESAQDSLKEAIDRMETMIRLTNIDLEIEHVCSFGGLDYIGNNLVKLVSKMKKICFSRPVELFQPLKKVIYKDYSDFCQKIVYFDLKVNIPDHQSLPHQQLGPQNYSEITVIAESINSIRRVTLLMYANNRIVVIYVLDPTKESTQSSN